MTGDIVKPLCDKKEYRYIELDNGMRILLISEPVPNSTHEMEIESNSAEEEGSDDDKEDPKFRLAAAALCVNSGSFEDPKNFQGLAHFLEHMLFLGSEKYPIENHFDDYLKSHSGHSNAFTEGEQTVYYFAVSQDHLQGALDIFASCLMKPMLTPNATDREVRAIQSEYEDNLLEDSSRRLQLLGMLAEEGHPFGGFPFGNYLSLIESPRKFGLDVNEELRRFFSQYYTSEKMCLCIQSHHSLDTMESWSRSIFGPLISSSSNGFGLNAKTWTFPFSMDRFAKMYRICPTRDMHELVITWSLPPLLDRYLAKPHHYLSFILGDEAEGSLISFLRKKRLGLQLVAGNDESGDEHNQYWCRFSLNIQLTDDGLASYGKVLRHVFSYLAMLRVIGPQKRIFDELKLINQFRFDYQDEAEAVDNVNTLSQYIRLYPIHHVLIGSHIFEEWNPEEIQTLLTALKPSECNIILSSKYFENSLKNSHEAEPWFHTKFSTEPLNPDWWSDIGQDEWSIFSLPSPNAFIPSNFSIKSLCDGPLERLHVDDVTGSRLWYKPGCETFAQPKTCVSLLLYGEIFTNSLRNRTALDIYLALLQLYLIEKLYPASVAGLKCSIKLHEFHKFGISIRFSGFSDKMKDVVSLVLKEIVNFQFSEDMFNIISAEIERDCRNSCVSPMDFAHQIRLATILNDYCAKFQRLSPHSSSCYMHIDEFRGFLTDWRLSRSCMLDCLISGNISQVEAQTLFSTCTSILNEYLCSYEEIHTKELKLTQRSQCVKLPAVSEACAPVLCVKRLSVDDDDNFAVVGYYQMGLGDFKSYCVAQLFEMIVSEPCFNILRTQKQLGYNCFMEMHDTAGTIGFSITVQSSHSNFNPKIVDDEIDSFLKSMVTHVETLSEEDFEDQVEGLIELKLEPFGNLKAESRYYWSEICNRGGKMFNRREKEAEVIETITQAEVVDFAKTLASSPRRMSIHVIDPAQSFDFDPVPLTTGVNSKLTFCIPKVYRGLEHSRNFVRDLTCFKQALPLNPHVEI